MMPANFLATPYVMDPLLETLGLRGCQLYEFWEGHKTWGDCTYRVNLAVHGVLKSSCLFDVLEYANEFVLEFCGGVLRDSPVCVSVIK